MSKVIAFEQCPSCADRGRDSRGDNLALFADGGYHCFSCGLHRNARLPVSKPSQDLDYDKAIVPTDFSREIPGVAWEWLLQYGLGWNYWKPYVGWSEKDSRLVFTVGTPMFASTGRFIPTGGRESKRKWFHYGNPKLRPTLFGDLEAAKSVVLVEDLISAHKLGQVGLATPLFGTSVPEPLVPILRHLGLPIIMWLDKDQEEHARKRANWLSTITGLPVKFVFTNKDPKALPLDKLHQLVL
jgi:hypothetical protein